MRRTLTIVLLAVLASVGVCQDFTLAALRMSDKLTNHSRPRAPLRGLSLAGARGETVAAQFAVIAGPGCESVNLSTLWFQGLMPAAHPIQFLTLKDGELRAEVISNSWTASFTPERRVVPIWVTVRIPDGTAAGQYRGTVTVTGSEQKERIPVAVRVYDFDLPKQQHLPTDFAFRPGKVWAYFNDTPGNDDRWWEHMTFERYSRWRAKLMEYRIPPQPYMDSPPAKGLDSMAYQCWLDGSWDGETSMPDWGLFDQQVEDQFANGAAMARLGYTSAPDPDSDRWRFWRTWLPQLERHVRDEGWERRCFIYQTDEVVPDQFPGFMQRGEAIGRLAPSVKRLTVIQHPYPEEINAVTDIWVTTMGVFSSNQQRAHDLQAQGDEVWVYVCCSGAPPFSELYIHEDGLNHRLLPWIIRKHGLQGLLYYGCCFWTDQYRARLADVEEDGTLSPVWGLTNGQYDGGGVLLYPGGKRIEDEPQVSLRLALLGQGLQDWEYFWLLDDLVRRGRGTERQRMQARALLEVPNSVVKGCGEFTTDERRLDGHKAKLARLIEAMD